MKKKAKFKGILIFILILAFAGVGTYSYTLLTNSENSEKKVSESNKEEKTDIEENKDNQLINDNEDIEVNNSTISNSTNNTTTDKDDNNNIDEVKDTSSSDSSKEENDFTKEKALEYFMNSSEDYKEFQLVQDNGVYCLEKDGKKVIEVYIWDVETSPVTGLKYYTYNLKSIEMKENGGTGTIEYGMIYEDGTIEIG